MSPEQDKMIEELFHEHFQTLSLYARTALHNHDRAQEVVQDTFHEAVVHIDQIMVHPNPGGWLRVTVKYKSRDSERERRRFIRRFLSLDTDLPMELADTEDAIARVTDELSPMQKIEQALTPEEMHLVKRLIFDRASHLEVARELNISVAASQKRLSRIRQKLNGLFPERKKNP